MLRYTAARGLRAMIARQGMTSFSARTATNVQGSASATSWTAPSASAVRAFAAKVPTAPMSQEEADEMDDVNMTLPELLDEEIAYEKENYDKPEEISEGPPNGFSVTEREGSGTVIMEKKHKDETITVMFDATSREQIPEAGDDEYNEEGEELKTDDDQQGDEEDDDDFNQKYIMSVSVAKDGKGEMDFQCVTDGANVSIVRVMMNQGNPMEEGSESYNSPPFDELDYRLQMKLHEYIFERGIDHSLATYVAGLGFDKENREYALWLEKVKKFVA